MSDVKAVFDRLYAESDYGRHPTLGHSLIVDLLRVNLYGVESVLDVGCGPGVLLEMISTYGIQRYAGTEICDRLLERMPQRLPEVYPMDGRALDFSAGEFDVVILADVLDHVPAQWGAEMLREAVRVAGRAVIVGIGSYPPTRPARSLSYWEGFCAGVAWDREVALENEMAGAGCLLIQAEGGSQ